MNEQFPRSEGFTGFKTFAELDLSDVPQAPGIYAVLQPEGRRPAFLEESVGGWFKKKNPTILLDALGLSGSTAQMFSISEKPAKERAAPVGSVSASRSLRTSAGEDP